MKTTILVGFYGIELLVTGYAFTIFMSYFKWCFFYEGSGMQFVVNQVIVSPALAILGVFYLLCFRWMGIPLINILMPWIIIGLVLLNPFFSSLNTPRVSIGAVLLATLIVVSFFFKLKHVFHF